MSSFLFSCVDFEDKSSERYTLYLNDSPVIADSVYYVINQDIKAKVLDASGNEVSAAFDFGNGTKISGTAVTAKYVGVGKYKLTITTADKIISTNIVISKALKFTLKINNSAVDNNSIFKTNDGTPLTFKIIDTDGKALKTDFDLGNGTKILTDSVTISYTAGSYDFKAVTGSNTITIKIEVAKANSEAIVLISTSISGSTISAILGLKCSLISDVSLSKETYVAGEIPTKSWQDYKIIETTIIGGINYFKWNISAPAGKYRLSWIQLKNGQTEFSYDNCNWANDLKSIFWSDGLFVFYLKIDNGAVKISATE